MLRTLKLRDVGPAPALDFDFSPRLNVLTGDNGLGKTFVLDVVWATLTTTWAGERAFPARPRVSNGSDPRPAIIHSVLESRSGVNENFLPETTSTFDRRSQRWESAWHIGVKEAGGKPREDKVDPAKIRPQSLVVYARTDGGMHIWDSYQVPPEIRQYERAAVQLSARELWDGKEVEDKEAGTKRVVCEGLIKDWVRWQGGRAKPFEFLRRVLVELSPPDEDLVPDAPTRVLIDDRRDIPTLALPYGIVPVTLASAGMRRVMGLAYALVWAWIEHQRAAELVGLPPTHDMVVLLDEVEAHLHPLWQRRILPAVLRAIGTFAPNAAVQMFVSTHAPLVLASLEPHFDPHLDALFTFDLTKRGSPRVVKVEHAEWRRMGDASDWLTSDVFDLKWARSKEAEEAILSAIKWLDDPRRSASGRERIEANLRRALGDTDPFWMRWSAHRPERGNT